MLSKSVSKAAEIRSQELKDIENIETKSLGASIYLLKVCLPEKDLAVKNPVHRKRSYPCSGGKGLGIDLIHTLSQSQATQFF